MRNGKMRSDPPANFAARRSITGRTGAVRRAGDARRPKATAWGPDGLGGGRAGEKAGAPPPPKSSLVLKGAIDARLLDLKPDLRIGGERNAVS